MQNTIKFCHGTVSIDEKIDEPHEGIPNHSPIFLSCLHKQGIQKSRACIVPKCNPYQTQQQRCSSCLTICCKRYAFLFQSYVHLGEMTIHMVSDLDQCFPNEENLMIDHQQQSHDSCSLDNWHAIGLILTVFSRGRGGRIKKKLASDGD